MMTVAKEVDMDESKSEAQIAESLLALAASQDAIFKAATEKANEAAAKAAKFREAAALISAPSNGFSRVGFVSKSKLPIRQQVVAAITGAHRTIPEICELTGLGRRQVTHALHSPTVRFDRRMRREGNDEKPEFRLKPAKGEEVT
jgi:hypothetical protein